MAIFIYLCTMACGRVENCFDQINLAYLRRFYLKLNIYRNSISSSTTFRTKRGFLWNGNADELGKFIEERILSYDEDEEVAPELVIS